MQPTVTERAVGPALRCASLYARRQQPELQALARHRVPARLPVGLFGREGCLLGVVDLHPDQGLLEAADDLAGAQDNLEGLVVPGRAEEPSLNGLGLHACVEDLASGELPEVVDGNRVALLRGILAQIGSPRLMKAFNDCA